MWSGEVGHGSAMGSMVGDITSKPASVLEPRAPKDCDKIQDLHDASGLLWVVQCHCEKPVTGK